MKDHFDLVLDVGNSRTKIGWATSGRITRVATLQKGDEQELRSLLGGAHPDHIVIGSVMERDPRSIAMLSLFAPVLEVTGRTPIPLVNNYSTPETVGVDRIANAVGAYRLFPGRTSLVVDAGTCVTYDLVEADGTYAGGAISPGKHMRARAMHTFSARLPLVEVGTGPALIGTTTEMALASGVHHGMVAELRGMIQAFGHHRPDMAVIITGGDALEWSRALKSGIFAHPILTLEGLHAILVHNRDAHGIATVADPFLRKRPGNAG